MSLFFALMLICLPAAALMYDFYKGGTDTMLSRQVASAGMAPHVVTPQRTMTETAEPHNTEPS